MDWDTVKQVRDIIQTRMDELRDQWEHLDRGTTESFENLARHEELQEMKWKIIDAAEDAAKAKARG
jgi:hypothetical protein